jgi:hypothetical protein
MHFPVGPICEELKLTPALVKSQFWAIRLLLVTASKIIVVIVKNLFMIHGFRVKNFIYSSFLPAGRLFQRTARKE